METNAARVTGCAPFFLDRSTRLTIFGILSVLVGAVALLFGLLYLLIPFMGNLLPEDLAEAIDWRSAVIGWLTYSMLGAIFVWAGLGSIRRRRWVRSVMLTVSWSWLLFGVLLVVMSWLTLDHILAQALEQSGASISERAVFIVKAAILTFECLFGVLLPALFVAAYRDQDLLLTCQAHDPNPGWADRCPPTVLGLSLGLGACAVLGLPIALRAEAPLFGQLVRGWPAVLLTLGMSVFCAYLARAIYRQREAGFWGGVLFLLLFGVSIGVTLWAEGLAELMRALGHPEDQLGAFTGALADSIAIWSSAGLTLASVAYFWAIRKYFFPNADSFGS
jgi:hypothetical protein